MALCTIEANKVDACVVYLSNFSLCIRVRVSCWMHFKDVILVYYILLSLLVTRDSHILAVSRHRQLDRFARRCHLSTQLSKTQ
jgi:hypothetical protein